MRWFSAVIVLSILNLAGCGSSGNPNAPVSTAPHETGWVAYHRNDIISAKGAVFSNATTAVKPGLLILEHFTQCQVCHGAQLTGAKAGAAGPACLDCHVLDPGKYPVMCYSCHGFPVVATQKWYSTNRASRHGLPLDAAFTRLVREEIESKTTTPVVHLKHKSLNLLTNDDGSDKCALCHPEQDKSTRGVKHHELVMGKFNLGCVGPLPYGCHVFNFSNPILTAPTFSVPNCSSKDIGCHTAGNLP